MATFQDVWIDNLGMEGILSKMPYSIYALKDPRDGQVRYVGLSKKVHQRFHAHLHDYGKAVTNVDKAKWIEEVRECGMLPILSIIEEVDTLGEAERREDYWIKYYLSLGVPLTNIRGIAIRWTQNVKRRSLQRQAELEPLTYTTEGYPPLEPLIKIEVVAARLGKTTAAIRRLFDNGELPGFKIGGTWYMNPPTWREYLREHHLMDSEVAL